MMKLPIDRGEAFQIVGNKLWHRYQHGQYSYNTKENFDIYCVKLRHLNNWYNQSQGSF